MPRHVPPPGAPCWFELASSDPPRSLAFLQAVFGWQAEAVGGGVGDWTSGRRPTHCGFTTVTLGSWSTWIAIGRAARWTSARQSLPLVVRPTTPSISVVAWEGPA